MYPGASCSQVRGLTFPVNYLKNLNKSMCFFVVKKFLKITLEFSKAIIYNKKNVFYRKCEKVKIKSLYSKYLKFF